MEAITVFAILAPRRTRAGAIRAMAALQIAIDYLDSLGERPAADPLGDGLRQHAALTAEASRGNRYLDRLAAGYRREAARLPAHGAVAAALERAVARCGEGQAHTHAAGHGDRAGLETWAKELSAPGLPLVGARRRRQLLGRRPRADRRRRRPAYERRRGRVDRRRLFPSIGALTVLLDDLVDRAEDREAGAHNYLAYYGDPAEAADRLDLIAHRAHAAISGLRHPHRHAAILAGVAGFYLSAGEADAADARPTRDRLLRTAGPTVRPIVTAMRRRRSRKQPESVGNAPGS